MYTVHSQKSMALYVPLPAVPQGFQVALISPYCAEQPRDSSGISGFFIEISPFIKIPLKCSKIWFSAPIIFRDLAINTKSPLVSTDMWVASSHHEIKKMNNHDCDVSILLNSSSDANRCLRYLNQLKCG